MRKPWRGELREPGACGERLRVIVAGVAELRSAWWSVAATRCVDVGQARECAKPPKS